MFKNLVITSVLGAITIILGAFGAHALKSSLSVEALQSFETAVRYQFYHVIILLFLNTTSILSENRKNKLSYLFFAGIICFSGSIYAIQLAKIPAKNIWFITPLGGLFFIIGWIYLTIIFLQKRKER